MKIRNNSNKYVISINVYDPHTKINLRPQWAPLQVISFDNKNIQESLMSEIQLYPELEIFHDVDPDIAGLSFSEYFSSDKWILGTGALIGYYYADFSHNLGVDDIQLECFKSIGSEYSKVMPQRQISVDINTVRLVIPYDDVIEYRFTGYVKVVR